MTGSRTAPPHPQLGEPEIVVVDSSEDVSTHAAARIVDVLGGAIAKHGRAHFATTGGSNPGEIYRVIASQLQNAIDWRQVHFWWGDDRFVPRDHPLSNVLAADSILFGVAQFAGQTGNLTWPTDLEEGREAGMVVPVEHIHPIPCGEAIARSEGPAWAAQAYSDALHRADLPVERGFPVFDLILLGVGPDGHLMSVFPNSAAFDRREWALDVPAPTHVAPHVARVTLNPGALGVARSTLMVTSGAAKADILGQIFTTERDVRLLPAQLVRHMGATWILDREAAAKLPAGLTA